MDTYGRWGDQYRDKPRKPKTLLSETKKLMSDPVTNYNARVAAAMILKDK